jgi:predicted nucleic acid-binding protein
VTLYLDSSALVKLYVEEPSSERVADWIVEAAQAATSRVAYVEARAAFARQHRERLLTRAGLSNLVAALDVQWPSYEIVDVSERLVRHAASLAERHGLRAYDAVHLGSALELRRAGADVTFACFDVRLARAARRERLPVPAA